MNRIFPLTLILVAAFAAAASPAGAAAPRFKADVYIHQSSEWAQSWTTPEICGEGYRHFFRGDGAGAVTYKAKGVPVTFKKSRGLWQTGEFALSGKLGRRAAYEVGEQGNPEGCLPDYVHRPQDVDTSTCGGKTVAKSSKSFWLMIIGGRLAPAGAFTGKDGGDPYDNACPDPSFKSAIVESVPSPQRKDVDKLIQSKRVRSIELRSGKSYFGGPLTAGELGFPGGVDHAGEGEHEGRWTIKLTRLP